MKKLIPIGISDFKKLIESNCYFIDKSLLIREFIENSSEIMLIPRPRRFGKTLNMSMIKYFFDIREESKNLFDGLKIEKCENIKSLKGKYPVIYISFKDLKSSSYEIFCEKIKLVISKEYQSHKEVLLGDKLDEVDKTFFEKILKGMGTEADLELSLAYLCEYLYKYYGKKVILLIDEYDTPIEAAYINKYYDNVIGFMRNILGSALKDNVYLQKAMVTGILRIAKESIFSGLNNLSVSSIINYNFSDKFGFTEKEIKILLDYYNVPEDIENIKQWYNGYIFGNEIIYNPWSIVNYIENPLEGLKSYWVNTSANELVKKLLSKSDETTKRDLEVLMEEKTIKKTIDDNIIMTEIEYSSENIWSFLLFTGYLKATKKENIDGELICELKIPNKEVYAFYKDIIKKWFSETINNTKYNAMISALVSGDVKTFEYIMKEFVINSISYFDAAGKEPEKVYHAFVLGMLVSLSNEYYVKSNKESGYGRYDVILIPKNISKLGIIIEFKKINDFSDSTIEEVTKEALNQIYDMNYRANLEEKNIKNILELAIVFKGKKVKVTQR